MRKKHLPVLFLILDFSPQGTPPPIHTAGGETLQHFKFFVPERNQDKKKKNHKSV